jgi:hypothetical protein|tara:strand:+ start:584 stop:2437 length:1854 start_codon:yes stop_codon:yes gene_type:complete
MGHNANTNYTVSQSITSEFSGDSVALGTLPNQGGVNGNVILTITPNAGFTVNSSDFTIAGLPADNTVTVTSSTITNPATGNALSVVQYNFISVGSGGTASSLPGEVESVAMFNSEHDYDSTASVYVPVTANNVVYVHVAFMNNFIMPPANLTLNIDIDGSASATGAIQYPAIWETWTSPAGSEYTLTAVGNPALTNMSLSSQISVNPNSTTLLNTVSGLVDDGVQTLLMTKTFQAASGFYFTDITEQQQFTPFGLDDWLPYFQTIITNQVFNSNLEETQRVYEFYYTNPPVSNQLGLDPTFGGSIYGLGFLFEYIVGTQATVYSSPGGNGGGISPLVPQRPYGGLVSSTSSTGLGGEVEDVNPSVISIPNTTFFEEVTNVVLDTSKEINAIGGESRPITLYGTVGATYSITISDGSKTYTDSNNTFTSGATVIDGVIGSEGLTNHLITYPAVTATTTYTLTLSSRFGTKLPTGIVDGSAGNLGTIAANITKTFTLSFASASDISNDLPADIVFSFADLSQRSSRTFKVEVVGDVGETFVSVAATDDAPDATVVAAMSVTAGSASGWEWSLSGFNLVHGGVDEDGRDRFTMGGTITVQTLGAANVKYAIALDTITNVS